MSTMPMWKLLTVLLLVAPSLILSEEHYLFDKEAVGAVFTPYNKFHDKKADYSRSEVSGMLELVSDRFQKITTYGMGTTSPSSRWNDSTNHPEGLVAFLAAKLNYKLNAHALTVDIGVWQGDQSTDVSKKELYNAFDAAAEANKIYPGTVTGIIMTTHSGDHQLGLTFQSLKDYQNKAEQLSLNMGIRSTTCDDLASQTPNSNKKQAISDILTKLDFIVCHTLPKRSGAPIPQEVEVIGGHLLEWGEAFKKINPNITIVGQTGWPSQISKKESLKDVKVFWEKMSAWAKEKSIRVDLFTAFDEPWKASFGPLEDAYGWWARIKNTTDKGAFLEKIDYLTLPLGPPSNTTPTPAKSSNANSVLTRIEMTGLLGFTGILLSGVML